MQSNSPAAKFIAQSFDPKDRLAVLAIDRSSGSCKTRIANADVIASDAFQRWLYHLNGTEKRDISVCLNPIERGAMQRTKENIAAVRHIHLDIDENGPERVREIRSRLDIPQPAATIQTSPGHYQLVWRVERMDRNEAESLMRGMIREFGADRAAPDVTRGIRMPGFANNKYPERPTVTIENIAPARHGPEAFPRIERISPYSVEPMPTTAPQIARPATPRLDGRSSHDDQSEVDWAETRKALATGRMTPMQAIQWLSVERGPGSSKPKPNPEYYARRTVGRAVELLTRQGQYPPREQHHERAR